MQALKALIVVLGVLILISIGLLAWGFYNRLSNPDFKFVGGTPESPSEGPAAGTAAPTAGADFGDVRVALPPGCSVAEIEDMQTGEGRLYVRLGPAGPCARIVVLDLVTGRVLGTLAFVP